MTTTSLINQPLKNLRKILSSLNKTYSKNSLFKSLVKETTLNFNTFKKSMKNQRNDKAKQKVEKNLEKDLLVVNKFQLKKELKDLCKIASKLFGGFSVKALKQKKEIYLNTLKEFEDRISTLEEEYDLCDEEDVLSSIGDNILSLEEQACFIESNIFHLDHLMTSIKRIKAEIRKTKKNIDSMTLKKTNKENLLVVKTLTNFQLRKKLKDLLRDSKKCFHGLSSVKSLKQKKELLLNTIKSLKTVFYLKEEYLLESVEPVSGLIGNNILSLEEQACFIEPNIPHLDYLIISIKRIKREINRRKKTNS